MAKFVDFGVGFFGKAHYHGPYYIYCTNTQPDFGAIDDDYYLHKDGTINPTMGDDFKKSYFDTKEEAEKFLANFLASQK